MKLNKFSLYYLLIRPIETVLAIFALIAFSPLLLLTALTIKINKPHWKIFFVQKRLGKDHKYFNIYKFTTMEEHIPAMPTQELDKNFKNQIPLIGKILRDTRINELPQLINIIKGEMRFVGPRPAIKNDIEIVAMRERTELKSLKPGFTFIDRIYSGEDLTITNRERLERLYLKDMSKRSRAGLDAFIMYKSIEFVAKAMKSFPSKKGSKQRHKRVISKLRRSLIAK